MKILSISLILSALVFSGCFNKWGVGEHALLHNIAKQNCDKIKSLDERQQCLQEHNEPFNPNKYQKTN
ncbi:hypothetical protein [Sulfuricurvum sp.]|uniref:hypothetical protein n=1 Tax=Sulfuricurvum sp. TaxID=2025608 RepID=UPI003BB4DEE3